MINSSLLTCSVSRVTLGFYRGGQGFSLERVRGAGAAREEEGQTGSTEGGRNRWRFFGALLFQTEYQMPPELDSNSLCFDEKPLLEFGYQEGHCVVVSTI